VAFVLVRLRCHLFALNILSLKKLVWAPNRSPCSHFCRFFCDKLLRSFAPRFLDNVLRCKKISDVGCQQMRLDTEVIKGLLVDLAKEGGYL